MGITFFEKLLGSLHLSFLLKTGDKKTTNQLAQGDINNNIMVIMNTGSNNQDQIAKETQKIIEAKSKSVNSTLALALGTYLGIVKSAEKPGTRVHLDFAVINKIDKPSVLQGSYMKINNGVVNLKMFYKSNANGSREPDMSQGFPVIVNSNGATKLQIEFENIKQDLIKKGINEAEIVVVAEDNVIASKKFTLQVDDSMIETLNQSQASADTTGVPSIFQATIQSKD